MWVRMLGAAVFFNVALFLYSGLYEDMYLLF